MLVIPKNRKEDFHYPQQLIWVVSGLSSMTAIGQKRPFEIDNTYADTLKCGTTVQARHCLRQHVFKSSTFLNVQQRF